eukprot:Tamp_22122.p1 GENE.Tamp_22122~~Tamp_22122.p1  ORF type:complete len:296 (-),score=25.57 Tamp_22122:51-938(-)
MGNHCCRCFGFGGKDSNDLEETLIASTNTSDAGMDAPSPGATAAAATLPRKGARSGLRAFLIVRHCDHGYLLLEACKKRKGGRHFQLPGGHVDAHELEQYGDAEGSRIAAARELHEETGIDFRDRLYRYSRCTPRAASLAPRAACVRRGGHCVFLCLSCYCCVERKEACFSWSARRRVSPGAQGGVFLLERKEACFSWSARRRVSPSPLLTRLLPLPLPPLLVLPSSPSCLHCLASREGHARAAGRGRAGQRRVAWPRPKRLRLASASCPCVCAQAVDWQCKVEGTLVPCLGPLP